MSFAIARLSRAGEGAGVVVVSDEDAGFEVVDGDSEEDDGEEDGAEISSPAQATRTTANEATKASFFMLRSMAIDVPLPEAAFVVIFQCRR